MKAVVVVETDEPLQESPDQPIEPKDILQVKEIEEHDDWEEGKPCPECGNDLLSVMALEEDKIKSANGKFDFIKKGDAIGPNFSILCPKCMTTLREIPVESIESAL